MTASLRRACADVGAPLGLVLEGGYSVEALSASMAALVPVLGGADVPPADDAPTTSRSPPRRARGSRRWWPALSPV